VWYKDVADRLDAAPVHAVDADAALGTGSMVVDMPSVPQRSRCLRQLLCPHQPQVLAL